MQVDSLRNICGGNLQPPPFWRLVWQNDWKRWLCTYQIGLKSRSLRAKIHPFISILNIGPRLEYLPKRFFFLFMLSGFSYNAAVLRVEASKSPISDFFLIKISRFAKVGKSKQSSFTHDLASSLVYEPFAGNTGTAICMPTNKRLLPVAGSRFFLLLIVHLVLSNGA